MVLQDPLEPPYVARLSPSPPLTLLPVTDMTNLSWSVLRRVLLELTGLQVPKEIWYKHNFLSVNRLRQAWFWLLRLQAAGFWLDCSHLFIQVTSWSALECSAVRSKFIIVPQSSYKKARKVWFCQIYNIYKISFTRLKKSYINSSTVVNIQQAKSNSFFLIVTLLNFHYF